MLYQALPKLHQLIEQRVQRLDDWTERLQVCLPQFLNTKIQQLQLLAARVSGRSLFKEWQLQAQRLQPVPERLSAAFLRQIEKREQRLVLLESVLAQLDFKKVLARGFALVRKPDGKLVTRVANAKGQELDVEFADGIVRVKS